MKGVRGTVSALASGVRAADPGRVPGTLALLGDPEWIARARRGLAPDGAALPEAAPEGAGAIVYAGGDLAALERAARAARHRPLAALLPSELERAAWRVPWLDPRTIATDPAALPRALATALGLRGAALAGQVPSLRDPLADAVCARAARYAVVMTLVRHGRRPTGPTLLAVHARMLGRLSLASGPQRPPLAAQLAFATVSGRVLNATARSLGAGRVGEALMAGAGTRLLGEAARRGLLERGGRGGSGYPDGP